MTDHAAQRDPRAGRLASSPRLAFLLVFALHVGLRALSLTRVPVRLVETHTCWEVTAVAMSLYERGEFADPYAIPTGPTAHVPPFHPGSVRGSASGRAPVLPRASSERSSRAGPASSKRPRRSRSA